ncbi:metal-sensing transcriptional repressor [Candidatus Falkowbacteria bacterium]|nr:metal-sensing transcriptional repressor [Candidatus Falkowbacteria bacterium]
MKTQKRKKAIIALKKAYSHLHNVIAMAEDDAYCVDVMQQNLSVIGLLKSAHQGFMENHLNTCFKNAMASKNEKLKQKMVDEILTVSKFVNK